MADPIEAHYTPDGDGWTVAVMGRGRTLTGRAPGLVAARDKADELAERIAPAEVGHKTVVHMLNGDAVEFTTAYLTARLARTEEPPPAETQAEEDRRPEAPDNESAAAEPAEPTSDVEQTTAPTAEAEPADGAESVSGETARAVPAPAVSVEGEQVAAKPTPAPRTEAQTAHPAASPAQPATPAEETRESRVQT